MTNLRFAWIVSVVATLGSLYFSEIKHFIPCTLCWFARILMYPQSILLTVALWKNEKTIIPYLLPFNILGIGLTVFHYLKQKLPKFDELVPCTQGVPCSAEYINWFGFVTIPFLACTAFTFITIFLILELKKIKKENS